MTTKLALELDNKRLGAENHELRRQIDTLKLQLAGQQATAASHAFNPNASDFAQRCLLAREEAKRTGRAVRV